MRIKNMKVYDLANELAEEIKKSEEYVTYRTAKEAINLNYELKKKIDEFENARYEAQIVALQTGKDDELKMKHVQELYGELIQNEEASKYFDAEILFNSLSIAILFNFLILIGIKSIITALEISALIIISIIFNYYLSFIIKIS